MPSSAAEYWLYLHQCECQAVRSNTDETAKSSSTWERIDSARRKEARRTNAAKVPNAANQTTAVKVL